MFSEYIQAALEHAEYDTLENGSHLATVQGLQDVIAIGDTIEECRKDLIEVIEEWIAIRLQRGFAIPAIDGLMIDASSWPKKLDLSKYYGVFGKGDLKKFEEFEADTYR